MTIGTELHSAEVLALRQACAKGTHVQSGAFQAAIGRPVRSPKALREWHDLLLFLLAHPHDAAEHQAASGELRRVADLATERMQRNEHLRYALINSGLEGAPLQSTYTLRLTRWMLVRWGSAVELFSVQAPLDEFRELVRLLVTPAEWETLDQPFTDVYELLNTIHGPSLSNQLLRLVEAVAALRCDERTRELLWSRMRIFVKVEGAAGCAMTFARGPMGDVFFHASGLQRGVDLRATVDAPLASPLRLSATDQQHLIDTARTLLASLHRETDPVTHAGAVELFDMGRGLRIALFHLDAEHRLPFDSYVGFMAFKNGVPLAYGGAWIFPGKSKVGINVFPAMRGGESALFFAQLLRLYRQRFAVDRFEAENYQLGHNNPDGLKSGAYWFYYPLGFRQMDRKDQLIAAREFKKLDARKGYLVPLKVLKPLVEHGLELVITESARAVTDTAALTMAVQRHVVEHHDADRQRAMRKVLERLGEVLPLGDLAKWSPDERSGLYLWALPLDLVPDLDKWSARDRQRLVATIKAKGARTETLHQERLKELQPLLNAWSAVSIG